MTAEDVKFSFERYKGASATLLTEKVNEVQGLSLGQVRFVRGARVAPIILAGLVLASCAAPQPSHPSVPQPSAAPASSGDRSYAQNMSAASAKYQSKNHAGAREDWEAAIAVLPSDREAYLDGRYYLDQAAARSRIAWTYLLDGKPERAKVIYEEAIESLQRGQRDHRLLLQQRRIPKDAAAPSLEAGGGDTAAGPQPPLRDVPLPEISQFEVPRIVPEVLLQSDPVRMQIVASIGPLALVGRLRGPLGLCTAGLVGYRIVLTAAHCVIDKDTKVLKQGERRTFTLDALVARRSAEVLEVHTHQPGRWDGGPGTDWALLVLDRHPHIEGKWLGVVDSFRERVPLDSSSLAVAGYASDINQGQFLTLHWGCSGETIQLGVFLNRCAGAKGGSGAPVLLTRGEYAGYVVGVHVGRILGSTTAVACSTRGIVPKLLELRARFPGPS